MKNEEMLLIGGLAVVGIILFGLQAGWFHDLIHMGEKPRDTPPDFTDRDALGTRPDAMYAGGYY